MKMRKSLAAVMAAACAVSSISASAFAATITTSGTQEKLSAEAGFEPITISVEMDTSIAAVINPYKIAVSIGSATTSKTGIASPEYSIVNNSGSDIGITVAAKTQITPGTGIEVVEKSFDAKKATEKQVFAFLNTTTTANDAGDAGVYASKTYDRTNASQLVFLTDETETAKELMNIPDSMTGYYQIMGDSTAKPETAWSEDDTVTLDITFDLIPYLYDDVTGTTGTATATDNGNGARTTIARVGDFAYNVAVTGATGNTTTVTFDLQLDTGYTAEYTSSDTTKFGIASNVLTVKAAGSTVVTAKIKKGTEVVATVTFNVTAATA